MEMERRRGGSQFCVLWSQNWLFHLVAQGEVGGVCVCVIRDRNIGGGQENGVRLFE